MQYLRWMILIVAVCSSVAVRRGVTGQDAGTGPAAGQNQAAGDDAPLLLEDEPLLLLEDEPAETPPAGPMADNSRCEVCHLNFAAEVIVVTHAREQIRCADCHGECDAHIDDESWASGGPGTPPEVMYPPERIDTACRECHDTHDAPALEILQRWQDRCAEKKDPSTVYCTDCHGHHRMKAELRKASWDKHTGQPIPSPIRAQQKPAGETNESPDHSPR